MMGIDIQTTVFAIVAFTVIGVGLASLILFTRAKLVKSEECKLFINNDESLTKSTPGGVTLLQALSSNGIQVPSPCGGKATCHQCVVQITDGASEPLETDKAAFSKQQLKEGWRLSCQAKVKHDIGIHVDMDAANVQMFEGKVVSNENVATFIKELVVEVPEAFPYRAGGYLQFHVPQFKTNTTDWKGTMEEQYWPDWDLYGMFDKMIDFHDLPTGSDEVIRAYSMASYPAEGKRIKFNIRIATPPFAGDKLSESIPWGICSSYTFALKPGDTVRMSGPYGESYMIEDNRELIFLIGGAGSSFGRSHILHLFNTEKTNRKVSMWYGARSAKENIYQEEYENLDKAHSNFSYHLVLSEPLAEDIEAGWPKEDPVKTNYLYKAFEIGQLEKMEEPEECLYYVCGPPMHNKSVLTLLDNYGVPRENIVLDDFGS